MHQASVTAKIVKICLIATLVASTIETVVAALTTAWMLVPWTGATEAVRAASYALLHGGIITSACAAALAWLNRHDADSIEED